MTAIVLAAGKSRRMGQAVPKVLLEVLGRPLISYVLAAARAAGANRLIAVVGPRCAAVPAALSGQGVELAVQAEPRGTGDALLACRSLLADDEECVVLCGDAPLVTEDSISRLVAARAEQHADLSVLTAELADAGSYGRVIRGQDGTVERVVECKDATEAECRVKEVNSGFYAFSWGRIRPVLESLAPSPKTGEYYLTDVVQAVCRSGGRVVAVKARDYREMLGANTPVEFDEVARVLTERGARGR